MPLNHDLVKHVLNIVRDIQDEIATQGFSAREIHSPPNKSAPITVLEDNSIYDHLKGISEILANSYAQIKADIQDDGRLSWAGTAHEIRQLLSTLLETLAPDEQVTKQSWYKQEPQTQGPTQKQRTRYILQNRNAGSRETKVVEQAANLDEWIGDLVRATYYRASDAAHRFKARQEAIRILRYFEAFAHDLLDLRS